VKKCHYCKQPGHFVTDCLVLKKKKPDDANTKNNDGNLANAIENQTTNEIIAMISDLHIGMISELNMAVFSNSND